MCRNTLIREPTAGRPVRLAPGSAELNTKGLDRTVLGLCRTFYLKYPQIRETASHKLKLLITGEARPELLAVETHIDLSKFDFLNAPNNLLIRNMAVSTRER